MGEVYRARDTRLARSVAIKVLPAEFANDARLRARLAREAQSISALNHPHICILHDVGSENGVDYLVLELCEGQTLADRIERGALPAREALRYGIEIADALSRAHRASVVHRDLKPSNVMLTKSGVKLLDFGLAQVRAADRTTAGDTTSLRDLTEEGKVVGSLPYMAPEVLAGKEADPRSDIFALGAVLYEMLGGRRAFSGGSNAAVIAAILDREPPPLRQLQPHIPQTLEHVVAICLRKGPDERWQSAHDVAEELRWMVEDKTPPDEPSRRVRAPIAAVAAAIAVVIAGVMTWRQLQPAMEAPVVRLTVPVSTREPPAGEAASFIAAPMQAPSVAISPDGKRIAYCVVRGGNTHIEVRQVDSFDAQPLPDTQGVSEPFFSPDGQWIGFFVQGTLRKIPVGGGTAQIVCSYAIPRGATWGADGNIYFTPSFDGGLWRVPENGGRATRVTQPNAAARENSHRWPHLLPDGKHILFTIRTDQIATFDDARIGLLSLDDGKWRVLIEGASDAQYVPTGHLVFGRAGALYAVPFDLKTLTVNGPRRKMIDRLRTVPASGAAHYAVALSGDLVYLDGDAAAMQTEVSAIDRSGRSTTLVNLPFTVAALSMSPDGTKLALQVAGANDAIWIHDLRSGSSTRVSSEPGDQCCPVWTSDGTRVIYTSLGRRILVRRVDGTGDAEEMVRGGHVGGKGSCSPDDTLLAYAAQSSATAWDVWLVPMNGAHTPRLLIGTPFGECDPAFSTDGKWMAYVSDENNLAQVYVRPAGLTGGRWQVSVDGGVLPFWSKDGRSLFFSKAASLFAADITTAHGEPRLEKPRLLFTGPSPRFYDATRDGFVSAVAIDDLRPTRNVNVVLNWKRELEAVKP